ncbi:MAG: ribosome maturation factor RimP [Candidatus Omnitrophica bacterium]|nr:ribosome maturation factor RimP [Candidatus Omnitrophota bacterium]
MDRKELSERLTAIIGESVKGRGLELVELICNYQGRDVILRLLVDKPEGGITIKECGEVNRWVSLMLDEVNIIEQGYIFEVSSPGLDRPLSAKNDFIRCLNKEARFFLVEPVNGKVELEGFIRKADENSVYVETEGVTIEIPFVKINKAKQKIK